MSVFPIIIFGLLLIFIIASVIIGLVIYTIIYNTAIKRKLSQGITTGRQWPQPKNIVLIILIVALSIACVVTILTSFPRTKYPDVNVNNIGTVESYLSHELQGTPYEHYIEAYETGKLSGYTLTEATEDEFSYKYFRSESCFDLLHPSFVLFVEYIGSDELTGFIDSSSISYGTGLGASGMICGETSDYFCIIGNVNHLEGHDVTYTLSLFSTESEVFKEFDRITSSENMDEPVLNAQKSVTFKTTEESILVIK